MIKSIFNQRRGPGTSGSTGAATDPRQRPAADEQPVVLAGIAADTRIETDFGPVPAMLLRPRDHLRTRQGEFETLQKVGKIAFDAACLLMHPEACAVEIDEGALGGGLPRRAIVLAPGQKLAVAGKDKTATFVTAVSCLDRPGVRRLGPEETVYYAPQCAEPAVILAEGVQLQI